jgi:hypothetical protein
MEDTSPSGRKTIKKRGEETRRKGTRPMRGRKEGKREKTVLVGKSWTSGFYTP